MSVRVLWKTVSRLCKPKSVVLIHRARCHRNPSHTAFMHQYMTLARYVQYETKLIPGASGELLQVIVAIQTAVKIINHLVRRAGVMQLFGTSGQTNIQGEEVKKLDVITNDLFVNLLQTSYATSLLVSEEVEHAIQINEKYRGKYIVCFDPLDGSSNFECAASIGSIFSVLRKQTTSPGPDDALQAGKQVVAAGYALYGSTTIIMLSLGTGVNGFMLDTSIGEFLLFDRDVRIPSGKRLYSANEAYSSLWAKGVTEFMKEKKDSSKGKPFNSRYIGSLVGDIHRILKYGGIFLHPGTHANPKGKLRLLYECIPVSYIITQAGGVATNGEIPILDIQPTDIHQRTTLYCGCEKNMSELKQMMDKHRTKPGM